MFGEPIHQPNDKFLMATFSIPENAHGLFRHHLPGKLAAVITWESLKVESPSFIDPRFATSESDLLFRIRIGQSHAYLYLLLEHQSREDPRMAELARDRQSFGLHKELEQLHTAAIRCNSLEGFTPRLPPSPNR